MSRILQNFPWDSVNRIKKSCNRHRSIIDSCVFLFSTFISTNFFVIRERDGERDLEKKSCLSFYKLKASTDHTCHGPLES